MRGTKRELKRSQTPCRIYWGSHGCKKHWGHRGTHVCGCGEITGGKYIEGILSGVYHPYGEDAELLEIAG